MEGFQLNIKIFKIVDVVIDRPLGSKHPVYDLTYPINYGYVENVFSGDGKEQDCYVLGVDEPITHFKGKVIAIIHRKDDVEDKWVVANKSYTKEEIKKLTYFTEKYFDSDIIVDEEEVDL